MDTFVAHFLLLFVMLFVGMIQFFTPQLSRIGIFFSVTVAPDFRRSTDGRHILNAYRTGVIIHSVVALGFAIFGIHSQQSSLLAIGVVWQVIGSTIAFITAHRRSLPHGLAPSTIRVANLSRKTRLPGGPLLQVGPFAMLAATGAWVALHWDALPDRIPTHWGIDGKPNGWIARTPAGVYGFLSVGLVVCGMLLFVGYGIATASKRNSAIDSTGNGEQKYRLANLGILLAAEYLVAFSFVIPGLFSMISNPSVPLALISIGALILLVGTFALFVQTGQQGSAQTTSISSGPIGDQTSDANWKLGLFYVNRNDPSLFIQKRFGFGYTFNFGNPWSLVILTGLLIIPLALTGVLHAVGR